MEEIDLKIIETAIAVAGESEANRFSTREIASRLGISEFMIYDHFHDKDNLLNLCDEKVASDYYDSVLKWAPLCQDFHDFFSHVMDEHIAYRTHGAFAINYCRVFPRYEKASDFSVFKANVELTIDNVLRYFPLAKREDAFALWCFFTREFTCDAQLFIDHRLPDTPANRYLMADLIYQGFGAQLRAK
jgi:AcrR family transcriptional regulator